MPAALAGAVAAFILVAMFVSGFGRDVMRVKGAQKRLHRGGVLVDVDGAEEFARHHPPLMVNIPLEELEKRAGEIGPVDRPVVVYAHSWERGALAVRELSRLGYRDVLNGAGAGIRHELSKTLETAAEAGAHQQPPARQPA